MSVSIFEIIESAGYNPRNPDDAIRLTAILNDEDIERLNNIIENTVELDYNRQRLEESIDQLAELTTAQPEDDEERQILLDDINSYADTIDELTKQGEKL